MVLQSIVDNRQLAIFDDQRRATDTGNKAGCAERHAQKMGVQGR
jgi:hypothetical protein